MYVRSCRSNTEARIIPDHFTTSEGSNSKEMTGNVDGTQLVIAPLERFRKHNDLSRDFSH